MLETFKFMTILLFILLFPGSPSLQSERISAFMADKGLEGGVGSGGSQIMGLGCQIGSKSFLWVRRRTEKAPWFFLTSIVEMTKAHPEVSSSR